MQVRAFALRGIPGFQPLYRQCCPKRSSKLPRWYALLHTWVESIPLLLSFVILCQLKSRWYCIKDGVKELCACFLLSKLKAWRKVWIDIIALRHLGWVGTDPSSRVDPHPQILDTFLQETPRFLRTQIFDRKESGSFCISPARLWYVDTCLQRCSSRTLFHGLVHIVTLWVGFEYQEFYHRHKDMTHCSCDARSFISPHIRTQKSILPWKQIEDLLSLSSLGSSGAIWVATVSPWSLQRWRRVRWVEHGFLWFLGKRLDISLHHDWDHFCRWLPRTWVVQLRSTRPVISMWGNLPSKESIISVHCLIT